MQTLMCPDCDEIMQQVEKVTARTAKVGINQLAKHCSEQHVLPSFERMLQYTASLGANWDELFDMTELLCPGCGKVLVTDSQRYVRKNGRTILCCSDTCQRRAMHG